MRCQRSHQETVGSRSNEAVREHEGQFVHYNYAVLCVCAWELNKIKLSGWARVSVEKKMKLSFSMYPIFIQLSLSLWGQS